MDRRESTAVWRYGLCIQLGMDDLGGTIDRDEEVPLAIGGPNLGDVDVQITQGVTLEGFFLSVWFSRTWRLANPMTLVKTVQAGAGQRGNGTL